MTRQSQIVAMISLRWPQRGPLSTSTENTRCIRAAQLIGDVEDADWLRGADGAGSCFAQTSAAGGLGSGWAPGATCGRNALCEDKTP